MFELRHLLCIQEFCSGDATYSCWQVDPAAGVGDAPEAAQNPAQAHWESSAWVFVLRNAILFGFCVLNIMFTIFYAWQVTPRIYCIVSRGNVMRCWVFFPCHFFWHAENFESTVLYFIFLYESPVLYFIFLYESPCDSSVIGVLRTHFSRFDSWRQIGTSLSFASLLC